MEKVKAAGQRRYRESLDELIDELRDVTLSPGRGPTPPPADRDA